MADADLGDERPVSNLRAQIMERRRQMRGPTPPTEATYEQWAAGLKKTEPVRWSPSEDRPTPHLYFIGSDGGPIKIGVSENPAKRLKAIQTSYPYRLRILAIVERGGDQERALHQRFAEHNVTGEWFHPAPEILAEITRIKLEYPQ